MRHITTRRVLSGGVLMMLVATAAVACGTEKLTTPCAVVVDGSGSGTKFDAAKRLDDTFTKFTSDNKCGTMSFVPIDSAPMASTCYIKDVDIDPDLGGNSDPETVRAGRRKLALDDAHHMLDCAKKNSLSDVLGGLTRAAGQRPRGKGTYQILVVSDMLQNASGGSLYHTDLSTPAAISKAVQQWAAKAPSLVGADLTITDCGVTMNTGADAEHIRSFWTQLLRTPQVGNPGVHFER
jgi:hypothetical protein